MKPSIITVALVAGVLLIGGTAIADMTNSIQPDAADYSYDRGILNQIHESPVASQDTPVDGARGYFNTSTQTGNAVQSQSGTPNIDHDGWQGF